MLCWRGVLTVYSRFSDFSDRMSLLLTRLKCDSSAEELNIRVVSTERLSVPLETTKPVELHLWHSCVPQTAVFSPPCSTAQQLPW